MSRNLKGHVSAVKCRQIFDLRSGTPSFSNSSFCPFWPILPPARVHFYMCSITIDTPTCLPLTCLLFTFLTSLYLYLFFSLLFATMVCVPPSMFQGWLHCAHLGLALWPHRNCGALVGSGGKQGGQGQGKRGKESRTHMWLIRCLHVLC